MANAFDEFDATQQPNAFDEFDKPRAVPGLLDRAQQGLKSTVAAGQIAATDDPARIAELVAQEQRAKLPATPTQQRMAEEIKPYQEAYQKSEGLGAVASFASLAAKRLSQFVSNPSELAGAVVENLPNSAPGMAGGAVGAYGGTLAAGPVGGVAGAVAGGTAGGYLIEQGAAMRDQVLKAAQEQGLDARDPNVLEPLIREQYQEFLKNSRLKGIGTAGTDAVLNALTFGVAGMGERVLAKEAGALTKGIEAGTVGTADAAAQLASIEARQAARNTIGARAARGTGIVSAEMAGEGLSEAAGQKLAYGQVDPLDVVDEAILGLGQGVGMAAGEKTYHRLTGGPTVDTVDQQITAAKAEVSRQRQLQSEQALGAAPDAGSAIAAANELAGSVDDLTSSVDAYLRSTPAVTQATGTIPTPEQAAATAGTSIPELRARVDREAELLATADAAGTDFERRMALEQLQATRPAAPERTAQNFADLTPMSQEQADMRLRVMRDEVANQGGNALELAVVPHPAQPGRFAIGKQALPSLEIESAPAPISQQEAQYRIESAAMAGDIANRRAEDAPRQNMISRAMANIEARGGVASPYEAELLRSANMGQPYNRIDPNLAPALTTDEKLTQATGIPLAPTPRETGSESQRQAAIAQTNAESMSEQERRNAANRAQAERETLQQIQETSQPAAAPDANEVIEALKTPGVQRSAEQVSTIRQAQARYSASDFSVFERAAKGTFQLNTPERMRLDTLLKGGVAPAQQLTPETVTPATPPLMGTRVAERLGLPSNGRIVTSGAKFSTQRQPVPGATLSLKDGETDHNVSVVDVGKLGAPGRMLQQIARIFGKRLVAFQSDTLQADGFVLDDDNRSIYINTKSEFSPLAVFFHELTHLLKRDNPQAYAALEAVVQRNLKEGAENYREGANLEEITSDLVGNRVLMDPDFIGQVFAEIAAQNPEGARGIILRMAAAINKAVNAFKKVVTQGGFEDTEALVTDLNAIQAAVKQALATYAQSQRETAMRMEADQARAESQVDLAGAAPAAPARATLSAARETPETPTPKEPSGPAKRPTPQSWKATPEDLRLAKGYERANGLLPYTSEGQIAVPVETRRAQFSVKREGKYGNHDVLGIPVNKNGTVTLYFPTTNADARRVVQERKLRGASADSRRIYLTNESSGPKVMRTPGAIEQKLDGANVLVRIDPSLLQVDAEYEDGRKDFFIPIAEGEAFAKKMAQTKLFTLNAPREKGLSPDQTLADITRGVTDGVLAYQGMTPAKRRQRLRDARAVLKREHNVGTLLGENGKLEKTRVGDYGLTYDGKSVASLGLGLASAQKINDTQKLTTCPQSAICESLCLGETSGQNLLYGGLGQFRSGPRLSQYLKTEALVQHPEDFAIALYSEIERFTKKADKEDFQVAIRLNVTSDFAPKTFEALIHAFPEVMFYDYTKLAATPIAPNHHLTYSSTGASQVVDGEIIVNPQSNWDRMVQRLNKGYNVAMAFTSRTDMPSFVEDAATGQRFQVWNGDNYDARFLDPKRDDGIGMIVGLTNKDRTTKPEEAASVHNGFFLDYNAERDGDTLVIPDQKALAAGGRRTIAIQPAKERAPVSTKQPRAAQFSRTRAEQAENDYTRVYEKYIGTPEWMKAPNGKPTKLTERQWVQVRTPQFKAWFGDWEKHARAENPVGSLWSDNDVSKVVDDNGEPLVVYHGTDDGGFSIFNEPGGTKRGDLGIFATPNRAMALTYVKKGRGREIEFADMEREPIEGGDTSGYYASFMNLRNPQEEDFRGANWSGEYEQPMYRMLDENGDPTGDYVYSETDAERQIEEGKADSYEEENDIGMTTDSVVREARGYNDGAIIRNVVDDGGGYSSYAGEPTDVFVAFKPNQLKSATQNTGEFGGDTGDLRFSRQRQVDTPEFKLWFGDSKVVDAEGQPLVVYHGGLGADKITIFDRAFGGQTTGNNEHGAFHFTDDPEVADDYARQSFIRRYQDDPEGLIRDGYVEEGFDFDSVDVYDFVEELADKNLGRSDTYLKIKNPIEIDLEGARVDVPFIERLSRFAMTGVDEEGDLYERYADQMFGEYDPDILSDLSEEIDARAREEFGLEPDEEIDDWQRREATDYVMQDNGYERDTKEIDGIIIRNMIDDIGDRSNKIADQFIVFDSTQIKSATGNVGTFDPRNPDIRYSRRRNIFGQQVLSNWSNLADSKADDVIYTMQDKHVDTKRVVEAIKSAVGRIDDKWNAYLQEELYHGRTAKQTHDFLTDELRPLLQEMQMRKVSMADFEEYLHNRHAEERNDQIAKVNPNMPDGGSGIDTQDARDYLRALDPAKRRDFEQLAKRVDAISAGTRKMLVASGLETQDTVDAWEKAYGSYAPLFREDTDFAAGGGQGPGRGYSVRGNASRRATGSSRPVVDILANLAMQRERTIVRAEKARVAQAVYGMAVQNPNTDFWLAVDPEGQKDPAKAIADLVQMGINPIDAKNIIEEPVQQTIDPRTGLTVPRVNPLLRSSDNVLAVRVDGRERYVFFNANDERAQRMVGALKNLDADQLGRVMGLMAQVTRYFASVNTQYNPIFGAINFMRDVQGATLNLTTTPIADKKAQVLADSMAALRGIYSDLRSRRAGRGPATGTWATLWEEFQREGGQTGFRDQFSKSAERAEALERELKKITEGKAKQAGRAIFDWLSDYNETMENAVRLAAYKAGLDKGLTKQQSASVAKNLTVNFNRKGQVATQAGALYAFFNASVQGSARMAETLTGPAGKKIIAGGLVLGVAQAMLLAAAGFDGDEPPDFVKERNLVLPLANGKYLTVPLPLGFNVIPNASRVLTEFALSGFREPSKRVAQIFGSLLDTFNPIGNAGWSVQTIAPTIADPLVALAENRDWTGKPIAKKDRSDLAPTPGHTRAKDTASWFAKELSFYLNLASGGTKYKPGMISPTPDQIDYLIGQATGGVGRELLKVEQTATSAMSGEELPPYKVPVLGRFYGDTKAGASESEKFYENLTRLNEHEAEIKGRHKNRENPSEYVRDNPEARLVGMANQVERDVQKLRHMRRELLDKNADASRVKLVEERIKMRMKQFNDRVKRAQEPAVSAQ